MPPFGPNIELDPADIIERLGLRPLPDEGGMWAQVLYDSYSSAIYYLLAGSDFSAFHRLPGTEIYHFYAGWPLEIHQLHPEGRWTVELLGPDLVSGQRPAVIVPGGVWQASRPVGPIEQAWSLVGTTMAPRFEAASFELGERSVLQRLHPDAASVIAQLTRDRKPNGSLDAQRGG